MATRRELLQRLTAGAGALATSGRMSEAFALASDNERVVTRAVAEKRVVAGTPRVKHVIAHTRAGRVRGFFDAGVNTFKGIPYGADTARFRFRAAPSPEAWNGVRDALEYGPACPQPRADELTSEDCLRLNVWTPALRDGGKRPVMVYFHGGEFSSGSGSSPLCDGAQLCRRGDVVVVTVNHRLNVFGHLYLARLAGAQCAASGNVGLLDLVQALRWVRDHAAELGGDPECVTVFGQSGGGAKIATLMSMPEARGLFHRAITMSGQQITASGPRGATLRARSLLDRLKVSVAELASPPSVSTERLVEATHASDPTLAGRSLYFGPVLDHQVLFRHPFYPDAPAQSRSVPMIIGNTHDETRAFLGNEPGIHTLSWEALPDRLLEHLFVDLSPEYVIAEYRRLYPQYTPTQVFFAATTAGRSWRGAIIEAELRAMQGSPAYAYQLDFRSPLEEGRLGALHALDIPLAFRNVAAPGSLTGSGADAQAVADRMSDAFIAFARTGNPNHAGLPEWRPYELQSRSTMVFDVQPHAENDPRGAERLLFAQVPYIQRGTY